MPAVVVKMYFRLIQMYTVILIRIYDFETKLKKNLYGCGLNVPLHNRD